MKIKSITVNCECFEDLATKQGIVINRKTMVNGNTCDYAFTRTDGSKGWARETGKIYAADAYVSTIDIYDAPIYCTQNDGDCETCSLVNYNRDCQNNPIN